MNAFPSHYAATCLSVNLNVFPAERTIAVPGMLIALDSRSTTKFCFFEAGEHDSYGMFACVDPDQFCALSGGRVTIVSVPRLGTYTPLEYSSIFQILPAADAGMLLLASYADIYAYGKEQLWHSQGVCLDELRLEKTDSQYVYASGFTGLGRNNFRLRLDSGEVVPD